MKEEISKIIRSLSLRQQVGLWIILGMPGIGRDKFFFESSLFAKNYKPYASDELKKDATKYGKFVGGVLSGLCQNGFLIKLSGGRDKQWAISEDLKNNSEQYKKSIFEVKSYWVS